MLGDREDQAAGLRRLFRRAPPAVVALYVSGHHAAATAVRTAHALAGQSHNVMVLDEATGEASLAAAAEQASALDLLHALDGRVELEQLCQSMGGSVARVAVSAAAMALPLLDDKRRDDLLALLRRLHRQCSFVLVHARDAARPSPFVFAAPRRLLVAEASGRGATEAYAMVKQLAAAGAGSLHVAVARARGRDDAAAFFTQLETLVRRHVGLPLAWLGEVERNDIGAELLREAMRQHAPNEAETAFLRRLAAWSRAQNGRLASGSRR